VKTDPKKSENIPGGVSLSVASGAAEIYSDGTAQFAKGGLRIHEEGQASFQNGAIDLGVETKGQVNAATGFAVNTVKVVGEQQPAIPDSANPEIQALIVMARKHGLIATS
jgi:hypothetical protein